MFKSLVTKLSKVYRNIRDFEENNLCLDNVSNLMGNSTIEFLSNKNYIGKNITTVPCSSTFSKEPYWDYSQEHYVYTQKGGKVSDLFRKLIGF